MSWYQKCFAGDAFIQKRHVDYRNISDFIDMSETKITIEESSKYFQKSIKHVAMQKPPQI